MFDLKLIESMLKKKFLEENNGPDGLRSRGSPIMSRVLYQAELQAPYASKYFAYKKRYRI